MRRAEAPPAASVASSRLRPARDEEGRRASPRAAEKRGRLFHVKHISTDRDRAFALVPEMAPAADRLETFVALLDRWRKVTDLVSDASFAEVWTRHVADSAQLAALAPDAKLWLDLGSGAGFPGLIVAIVAEGATVHCVDSDSRKCAFLREAARACGARAVVHASRIEALAAEAVGPVDVVTARAFGPLPRLLAHAKFWLKSGAVGLFPQGESQSAAALDPALVAGFDVTQLPNCVEPAAAILRFQAARPPS